MKKFLLLCVSIFLTPVFASAATTISSNITTNQTWTTASSTFIITADISIASGVTLTINPGVIVKFNGTSITVNGTLNAPGTATSSIYFTSYHDDSVGGDTNGNGSASTPAAGNWGGIITNPGASTTLVYAEVRYGGNSFFSSFKNAGGIVTLANTTFATTGASWAPAFDHKLGTTTITSCTFQNGYYGIYVENTSPSAGVLTIASSTFSTGNYGIYSAGVSTLSIASSTFTQYSNYGLYTERNPILSLTNSSFATNTVGAITFTNGNPTSFTHSANKAWGNGMNGILIANPYISVNQTWFGDTIPYVISGTLNVSAGYTLTIATSSVLKFNSGTVSVSGTLKVASATATPVYFTSYKDDIVNDTNNNGGSTSPAPGDWQNIAINNGGVAEFTGAVIRYAGSGGSAAVANSGTVTLINSEVASSSSSGIAANAGMTMVSTSTIHDNGSYGFSAQGGYATVTASTIKNHSTYGFVTGNNSGINLTMYGNTFFGNTQGAGLINVFYAPLFKHWDNMATGTGKGGVLLYGTTGNAQIWYGDPKLPYIISTTTGDLIVTKTVTVGAGSVFKFEGPTARIYVGNGGVFNAIGWNYGGGFIDALSFTSIKDDTKGGDTNGDGSVTSPTAGDWQGIELASGAVSNIMYSDVIYGGNSAGPDASVYNSGGTLTIATSTVASSTTSGIFHNSGTTNVSASVILHNSTYGLRHSGTLSTTTAEYNFWGSYTGPTHASNPGGTGDTVTNNVDFNPWTDDEHYLFPANAVDGTGGYHIQWEWEPNSTQEYADEWEAAIATWNELGAVDIRPYVSGLNDVTVSEVDEPDHDWSGIYEYNLFADDVKLNRAHVDDFTTYSRAPAQSVWTHELGHALGIDHSFWGNILYGSVSTQIILGVQDIRDYLYCWVDDNC